jgi:hypothetical protein
MTRVTNSSTSMVSRSFAIIASAIEKARQEMFNSYRPELHYMRGPGPKWRAKNSALAPENGPRV